MEESKKWYTSKGIWLGAIAFVGGLLQFFGVISAPVSPETQLTVLGVLAVIVRMITKSEVKFK